MTTNICIIQPILPDFDKKEILRYAGVRGEDERTCALLDSTLSIVGGKIAPRLCYIEYPVCMLGNSVGLGHITVKSLNLATALSGCESAVIFAATVGIEIDRLIHKYSDIEPARALLLQAIGTERVEALCDLFCHNLKEERALVGQAVRPRFSPGYGDLPLDLQIPIFEALNCPRNVGITLNDSLLMSPSKSVTAIVGIKSL